jgi:hypothetical protein
LKRHIVTYNFTNTASGIAVFLLEELVRAIQKIGIAIGQGQIFRGQLIAGYFKLECIFSIQIKTL